MTQFVAVRFNPWDYRSYTYCHDGEPVAPGDMVEVNTPKEGPKTVVVESVTNTAPAFQCKPVSRVIKRTADDEVTE
ncbi:hypothetical protein [Oceaniglobus ichthyenteri]|uniref:hypothetical protein n=1 Tax=Oceaniglobus ichthyenteri TaxID=2136177 RepID=UPI000D3347D9|nr:hypothetical protein [Oceaniglobus ichthyenteri]